MQLNPAVSRAEWLTARRALLLHEKEATHIREAVNAARQALPWVTLDQDYAFDTPNGQKSRMGWRFPWVSSAGSRFNFDFNVSFTPEQRAHGSAFYNFTDTKIGPDTDEMPGLSAFFKDETGAIFHTYSAYARGLEEAVGTLMLLDRAPKGRNETTTMDFVRRHDEYETGPPSWSCCA